MQQLHTGLVVAFTPSCKRCQPAINGSLYSFALFTTLDADQFRPCHLITPYNLD